MPTTRGGKRVWSNGKRPETTEPQPPISGRHGVKLYRADSRCEKVKFSPFSGAGSGAIFPAAAFFPSTRSEGTSVPVEVGWSLGWYLRGARPLTGGSAGKQRHRVDQSG